MMYTVEYKHNDILYQRDIPIETFRKIPLFLENIDLIEDNFVNVNIPGDYGLLFDILEGSVTNLKDINNTKLENILIISDYMNIDPRLIIYVDIGRFSSFFGISRYPLPQAINRMTNLDFDILRDKNNNLETVKRILKSNYINKKFYADYAFYILNNYNPKDYKENYMKETMKAILILNIVNDVITPINREEFIRLFNKSTSRRTSYYIDY